MFENWVFYHILQRFFRPEITLLEYAILKTFPCFRNLIVFFKSKVNIHIQGNKRSIIFSLYCPYPCFLFPSSPFSFFPVFRFFPFCHYFFRNSCYVFVYCMLYASFFVKSDSCFCSMFIISTVTFWGNIVDNTWSFVKLLFTPADFILTSTCEK